MESLPAELHMHMCSYLVPRIDDTEKVSLPSSDPVDRQTVYMLRLVSRRMCLAAGDAFREIVSDVPTKCTRESLEKLLNLLSLPQVGGQITRLTFRCTGVILRDSQIWSCGTAVRAFFERDRWIQTTFPGLIADVFGRTPNLAHLRCMAEKLQAGRTPINGLSLDVDDFLEEFGATNWKDFNLTLVRSCVRRCKSLVLALDVLTRDLDRFRHQVEALQLLIMLIIKAWEALSILMRRIKAVIQALRRSHCIQLGSDFSCDATDLMCLIHWS